MLNLHDFNNIDLKWEEIPVKTQSFQLGAEPERIHIIKSGFSNEYILVLEDAFEVLYGQVEILTKDDIEQRFNIKLTI